MTADCRSGFDLETQMGKGSRFCLRTDRNGPNVRTMVESLELLCVWAVMVGLIGLSPVFWAVIDLFR
jgi:hypothetical protein